jgi:putative transposase
MLRSLGLLLVVLVQSVRSRHNLLLENLALRQQLAVLKKRHSQPRFATPDMFFWMLLSRLWPGWKQALVLVQPETVVRRHRAGFKLNPTWGSPRIHGELNMLGFNISERTAEGPKKS